MLRAPRRDMWGRTVVHGRDRGEWEESVAAQAELELDDDAQRTMLELAVTAAGIGTFDWDLLTGRLGWDERTVETARRCPRWTVTRHGGMGLGMVASLCHAHGWTVHADRSTCGPASPRPTDNGAPQGQTSQSGKTKPAPV